MAEFIVKGESVQAFEEKLICHCLKEMKAVGGFQSIFSETIWRHICPNNHVFTPPPDEKYPRIVYKPTRDFIWNYERLYKEN